MFKLMYSKKAQSSLEFCILIVIIIGALIAMQVYIKRAIQGRLRLAADDIGEQYSPGNTYSESTTNIGGFSSVWAKMKPLLYPISVRLNSPTVIRINVLRIMFSGLRI